MGGAELTATANPARLRRHRPPLIPRRAPWGVSLAAVAVLSALAWLLAWAVVAPLLRGWTPTVVMSGSMAPAINTGDVVVMAPYRPADADVGTVISFEEPSLGRSVVHRVVALTPDGHYITRGDANAVNDSTSVDPRLVQGVGRVVVPHVGLPVVWAANRAWGQLLALAGVVAVMVRAAGPLMAWRPAGRRSDGWEPVRRLPESPGERDRTGTGTETETEAETGNGTRTRTRNGNGNGNGNGTAGRPPVPAGLAGSRLVNDPNRPRAVSLDPGARAGAPEQARSVLGAATFAVILAFLLGPVAAVVGGAETAGAVFTGNTSSAANGYGTGALAAPTALTADRSTPGQVELSWTATASTWATGYDIYRSSTSGCCYSLLTSVAGRTTTDHTDLVAGPTPTFVSASTVTSPNNLTSITVAKPAGVASGDLLVAHISTDNSNTFSAPGGWTLLGNLETGGLGDVSAGLFYRVAGGSEPASYTFTWGDAQDATAAILAYRNVDAGSPFFAGAALAGDSSTPTAPSVTTTAANALVVRLFTADDNSLPSPSANVHPAGTTGRYALQSNDVGGVTSGAADAMLAAAGATGTASFTLSGGQRWIGVTLALRPAAAPTHHYVVAASYLGWRSPNSNEA